MQESKIFLILIDETTDVSHPEQVSFVVRYVHTRKTKEQFIQVCNVHSTSGDALGNLVVALLEQNDLEIENVQGQGCNWAANIGWLRSKKKILKQNPKAKYVHSHKHCLNLVLAESAKSNICFVKYF